MENKNSNQTKIVIELPSKIFPYPPIRVLTSEIVKNLFEVSEKWVHRIELIVDELFNNAAEHGSNKDDIIRITFLIDSEKHIEIHVEDQGNGPNKKSIDEIKKHILEQKQSGSTDIIANQSVRGRGLAHIVSKWSDELDIHKNQKNGLSFKVKINNNKE